MRYFAALARNLDPLGRTGRRTYAQWGFGLAAVKILIDRAIAYAMGVKYWGWPSYWGAAVGGEKDPGAKQTLVVLLAVAVPFVVVGVLLTVRRLRDSGAPPWLMLCFFLPAVNVVTFIILCLLPSHDGPRVESPRGGMLGWLVRVFALRNRAISAVMSILLTILLMVPMTWLSTVVFRSYGWGIFVGMPFLMGLLATTLHGAVAPRSLAKASSWDCWPRESAAWPL
jgi:uncharacterized membrane protein YhaH (DUF805 family)